MDQRLTELLKEQITLARGAASVLEESHARVEKFSGRLSAKLTVSERESCEALASRFARLNDLLIQRLFRTVDQLELIDAGSPIDRLQRMEKRGIIGSVSRWRELRNLRNVIAHDYLIESADRVLLDAFHSAAELIDAVRGVEKCCKEKGYAV
jgi:hypothetical protein